MKLIDRTYHAGGKQDTLDYTHHMPVRSVYRITPSHIVIWLMLISICFVNSRFSWAQELTEPANNIILTVSGNIEHSNRGADALFDYNALIKLGLHTLSTTTNWTDGVTVFEGVLARDLLAKVGAQGKTVRAIALNDYTVDIPISDFQKYDVLLALKMDGQELLRKNKGPIWIIYPKDQHPELRDAQHDSRWIWHLKTLIVL